MPVERKPGMNSEDVTAPTTSQARSIDAFRQAPRLSGALLGASEELGVGIFRCRADAGIPCYRSSNVP
jgi:hypothetical protein